ncbi:MAG: phosphoribosylglycinamide formyltransferase [Planctomycetes bacterium]|nr:phosphoribosylglycinamide formyltransferase [Planctomycetota bacterium]
MTSSPLRASVLLSGGGRTLQNLIDRIESEALPLEIRSVISNRSGAYGLERARLAGLPTKVIGRKGSSGVADYTARVFAAARAAQAEWVLLAGFLRLLAPIPADFQGRVLNIHPALIPAFAGPGFYGEKVHAAALARGVRLSGCTVHFVDDEYDHGPILVQRSVEVRPQDTVEELAARVFQAECLAYPEAIRLLARGEARWDSGRIAWGTEHCTKPDE